MKLIPIADAKAHLSEILAALGPGEEVVVTRHGVPVARVVGVGERNRERAWILSSASANGRNVSTSVWGTTIW